MNKLAISSLAYGANVRASASFGNNIEGFLLEGSLIQQTGPQQGDRWLPVKAEITGITKDVFVSKNVVRAYTTDAREALV